MASEAENTERPIRVFVSSTFIDNEERRKIVEDAILGAGLVPVGMERFTASSQPVVVECVKQVRSCDWLIGIVAYRYGWVPEGEERSITEIEYDTAKKKGMPCLMFVLDESVDVNPQRDFDEGADRWDKQKKLDRFKARFGKDQMPARFREQMLGTRVLQAITDERNRQARERADRPEKQPPEASSRTNASHDASEASLISEHELQRYLAKAESLHHKMQLVGFETTIRVKIKLDDLYVPLDAMLDRGRKGRDVYGSAQHALLAKGHRGEISHTEIPLAEAFTRARAMDRRGVIMLGDPGSGKTTHLKRVLLEVIGAGPESIGLPEGTVPVFLPLRNLRDRSKGLPGFIQQELHSPLLDVADDFGERLCRRGKLLYLLDGLDEVADGRERAQIARWIEQALNHDPHSYFLVSCRYAGYTKDVEFDADFLELHLRPLTNAQMTAFVTRWYEIVERESLDDPQQAAIQAKQRTKDLLKTLSRTDFTAVARVYELTRNPLLLTAICLVHRDRGGLPRARAQLYEESIAVLLERWCRRFPEALHPSEALQVLRPIARWMHGEQGRTRASAAELKAPVEQGLSTLRHVEMGADRFLRTIRDESGLLTGWGMDEYGFMHLGLQEFLAAQDLRNAAVSRPADLWALAQCFEDSWWQEVILLMLAQRNPSVFDQFMRALVRQPRFARWHDSEMMQLCMNEAAVPSAVPFVELLSASAGDGDSDDMGRRQLTAAMVLARSMPEEMEPLAQLLRDHPAPAVRTWWRERQRQSERGGEVVVAPRGGVELVRIPAGRFMMGSPEDEAGRDTGYPEGWLEHHPESPQHAVELASFYLAKTPVTNAQYAVYLKANPEVIKPKHWGDRQYNQPDQPVVGVSWDEAHAYCTWAGLSLPTEAQWEYACRAGTETRFHSGDNEDNLAKVGWYWNNSDHRLHTVGEKEPNGFGLYDMHGNVWEPCQDNWVNNYRDAVHRSGDGLRTKPEGDANRVLRGGSWFSGAVSARSAYRYRSGPGSREVNLGIRPAQIIR